jgi:hypothetical protein
MEVLDGGRERVIFGALEYQHTRLRHTVMHGVRHQPRMSVDRGTLPYRPEYGFLSHVPSNAIRLPGYMFVPGVGILGESCDLPTSACSNQYRDIQ